MKLIAKYLKRVYNELGHSEITLCVPNRLHQSWLNELENDIDYSVEIKKVKSKRSVQQNKLLWSLLHLLENATKELAIDWYIKALVDTGAVVDYVWGTVATEDMLKKSFRAVQRVKPHKIKNSDGWLYRVIVGSSKFNIAEMNELIDTVLRYCAEHNIDTELLKYEEVK
jgi:hypothetical protein